MRTVVAEDDVTRPIVPVKITNASTGRSTVVLGMIDSGADRDVLSLQIVKKLDLPTEKMLMRVHTVNCEVVEEKVLASFILSSIDEEYNVHISNALTGELLTGEADIAPCQRDFTSQSHLRNVPFPKVNGPVQLIIGAAHYDATMPVEARRGPSGSLTAFRCGFGWTVAGKSGRRSDDTAVINAIHVDNVALSKSLDRMFYHDFAIVSEEEMGQSEENRRAVKRVMETIYFDENLQKYVVGLPWRYEKEKIVEIIKSVNARAMTIKRTKSLRYKLSNNHDLRDRVFKEMDKFVDTGVAIEIDPKNDDASISSPRWYLPIHVVEERNKTRICHDGRAETGGICLNELLIGGPNIMNVLTEVLMKFRLYKIGLMTDIKAFFHNVRVHPEDADTFRYMWFTDKSMREAVVMLFLAHIFGSVSSSLVTSYVLRHHAEKIKPDFPENVYEMLRHAFYVDDGSGGADSVDEALQLKQDLIAAMKSGGFTLTKWKSNAVEVMDEDPNVAVDLSAKLEEPTKVLGVQWLPSTDCFIFRCDPEACKRVATTPRELVSMQADNYDPLGFTAPRALEGRRCLQLTRASEKGWDSTMEEALIKRFAKWYSATPLLIQIEIPRHIEWGIVKAVRREVHIFCDAAIPGFGVVGYWLVEDEDGTIRVTILCAKAHVVPLDASKASHHNSVPRLEMTAAEKAVKLKLFIKRTIPKVTEDMVTLWSDSEAVLKMIFDHKSKRPSFFANRLSKIHSGSSDSQWRWVDTENNPADYCSRGIDAGDKEKWDIFHFGPKFLYLPKSEWPVMNIATAPEASINAVATEAVEEEEGEKEKEMFAYAVAARRQEWVAKLRLIAVIVKCAQRWRQKVKAKTRAAATTLPNPYSVSMAELYDAQRRLINAIQFKHFHGEITKLKAVGKTTPLINDAGAKVICKTLRHHNPVVDEKGTMRVGSRLVNADIGHDEKYPMILPSKDPNVASLIRHVHHQDLHAGPKHVLCQLRRFVWILRGLQAVKTVIHHCVTCQRNFKDPMKQQMAPLPQRRLIPTAPFEEVGLDCMGHFLVKLNGRADHKVWAVVFTCMVSRAVHVEVLFKMDTEAMINAIIRFAARRQTVRRFISDCGTNLVGANRVMKEEMQSWNASSTVALQQHGLQWDFIPPGTPHYGGVWERVVSLFKKHLASITSGHVLHYDVFQTAVIEVEGILNRRPLTPLSDDPSDTSALRPVNILHPSTFSHSSAAILPPETGNDAVGTRCRWRNAQARVDAFWKVWRAEYLQLLHARSKWTKSEVNIKKDALVIIVDETLHRHQWSLGRVVEVEGSGGHVRKAQILRPDGKIVLKDRSKIVRLELDSD